MPESSAYDATLAASDGAGLLSTPDLWMDPAKVTGATGGLPLGILGILGSGLGLVDGVMTLLDPDASAADKVLGGLGVGTSAVGLAGGVGSMAGATGGFLGGLASAGGAAGVSAPLSMAALGAGAGSGAATAGVALATGAAVVGAGTAGYGIGTYGSKKGKDLGVFGTDAARGGAKGTSRDASDMAADWGEAARDYFGARDFPMLGEIAGVLGTAGGSIAGGAASAAMLVPGIAHDVVGAVRGDSLDDRVAMLKARLAAAAGPHGHYAD